VNVCAVNVCFFCGVIQATGGTAAAAVVHTMRSRAAICIVFVCVVQSVSAASDVVFSAEERARIKLHGPWPVTVSSDPGNEYSGLPSAEEVGKLLFHDTGLSGNGKISCATCHQALLGYSDGKPLAEGSKVHFRNTQTLLNVGLQRWFGWDGGTDSLWAAALRPLFSELEMDGDVQNIARYLRQSHQYRGYFNADRSGAHVETNALAAAVHTDEALVVKAAKLIASYVRTIASGITPFDQFYDALRRGESIDVNIFSDSARRGLKLFVGEARCYVCHYGANFSNGEFHDIGRPFFTAVGQVDPGRYRGIQRLRSDPYNLTGAFNGSQKTNEIRKTESVKLTRADWGRWRTPGLRNLTHTGPYMHDGSITRLREVVDAYADIDPLRLHSEGEAIVKPLDLSDQQREDLVTFLQSLSVATQ